MAISRTLILPLVLLSLWCGAAQAITQEIVIAGAEKVYRERIVKLSRVGMLDRDAAFVARLQRITDRLAEQAARDGARVPATSWEIHASDDPDDNAFAMAGGKLLVSQPYIERLALTDAELAMVLSHEMQHVILLHNLQEYEEAIRLDPTWGARPFSELEDAVDNNWRLMARLAGLNKDQEAEADRAGLAMAWRAGWKAMDLAGFYKKLLQEMGPASSATHASPLHRWRTARRQAEALDAEKRTPRTAADSGATK